MNTSLRRHRTTHRAVVTLALAALAVAACGSDDDSATTESTEAAADGTEASADTDAPDATEATPDTTEAATDGHGRTEATDATTDASAPAAGGEAAPMRIGFLPPGLEIPAFQGLWHGTRGIRRRPLRRRGRRRRRQVRPDRAGPDDRAVGRSSNRSTASGSSPSWPRRSTPPCRPPTDAGIVVIAGGVPADYGFDSPPPGMTFRQHRQRGVRCRNRRDDGRLRRRATRRRGGSCCTSAAVRVRSASRTSTSRRRRRWPSRLPAPRSCRSSSAIPNDVAGTQSVIESALQANPDVVGLMAGDAESTMAGAQRVHRRRQ